MLSHCFHCPWCFCYPWHTCCICLPLLPLWPLAPSLPSLPWSSSTLLLHFLPFMLSLPSLSSSPWCSHHLHAFITNVALKAFVALNALITLMLSLAMMLFSLMALDPSTSSLPLMLYFYMPPMLCLMPPTNCLPCQSNGHQTIACSLWALCTFWSHNLPNQDDHFTSLQASICQHYHHRILSIPSQSSRLFNIFTGSCWFAVLLTSLLEFQP